MIWTIPNVLTLARLAAAPGIAVPFLVLPRGEAEIWALGIFLAAALTDALDGWLARRLGQESALGRVLDPIADKAMVVLALALVLALHGVPFLGAGWVVTAWGLTGVAPIAWPIAVPVALILFREILVSGLREAVGAGPHLAVTRLAKAKTAAQMTAIAVLLAIGPAEQAADGGNATARALRPALYLGGLGLLWLAALLTAITGWDYAVKAFRYIRGEEDRT